MSTSQAGVESCACRLKVFLRRGHHVVMLRVNMSSHRFWQEYSICDADCALLIDIRSISRTLRLTNKTISSPKATQSPYHANKQQRSLWLCLLTTLFSFRQVDSSAHNCIFQLTNSDLVQKDAQNRTGDCAPLGNTSIDFEASSMTKLAMMRLAD